MGKCQFVEFGSFYYIYLHNLYAKMSFKTYLNHAVSVLLAITLAGCHKTESILYSIDDLSGSHIAVLEHCVSEHDFESIFPESGEIQFKSSSEFLLALAIGKCDAGIVRTEVGKILLDRNEDYQTLTYPELQMSARSVALEYSSSVR